MAVAFEWGLQEQRLRLGSAIDAAVLRVLDHGEYVLGPEVSRLERALAQFTGARHCITCGNGTNALLLALMALDIGPGDIVFVPAFSFVASAEPVALLGATPCFIDVLPDSFNIDPASLQRAVIKVKQDGLRARAVIAVDLFGQPADYATLRGITDAENLFLISDFCQSMGAQFKGRKAGVSGDISVTSFFPTKPLGCYGDGGAVFTESDALAQRVESLRVHGREGHRYENVRIGINSRLDTLQAAVLLEKLTLFADEVSAREEVAARYTRQLAGHVAVPVVIEAARPSWSLYTVRVENRDEVQSRLTDRGIPSVVCYPTPIPRQRGYRKFPLAPGGVPVSESLSRQVLSLPVHPYLSETRQAEIIAALLGSVSTK
jgi:dTDP-4-amino-4,6-dideoxygalactose transaminase